MQMFKMALPTFEGRDIQVVHFKVPSYYGNVFKGRILVLAGRFSQFRIIINLRLESNNT